jgi:predicted metal-dependent HD superfamily phosphohydrolase
MTSPQQLAERFSRLWRRLGAAGDGRAAFETLRQAYEEPHRHYHGLAHLLDCLEQLDSVRPAGPQRDLVEAALWFHDAVYDPRAADNEARSAELAMVALTDAGVPESRVREIVRLIRLTDHARPAEDESGALIGDVDLSILGREPTEFAEYERRIRAEYDWVAEPIFRANRATILARLLDRDPLYRTEEFRVRYEERARQNLKRALAGLAERPRAPRPQ